MRHRWRNTLVVSDTSIYSGVQRAIFKGFPIERGALFQQLRYQRMNNGLFDAEGGFAFVQIIRRAEPVMIFRAQGGLHLLSAVVISVFIATIGTPVTINAGADALPDGVSRTFFPAGRAAVGRHGQRSVQNSFRSRFSSDGSSAGSPFRG